MPHRESQIKSVRKNAKRRVRNKMVKSRVKTLIKNVEQLITEKEADRDKLKETFVHAISTLDRAALKGILHKNNVARKKAHLHAKLNQYLVLTPVDSSEA